ncbi:hypothetical protein APQ14_06895 [Vibrio toranzoniae]|uniref:Uncharacterized protein n=1 Tax=Vibrio toranzoniae TaxID=1194427 RepID=A0A120DGU7_9VIBR|nr:hypothetical protein [Vibrio toranzoniae]KWU01428.1 hypothetical protein APQ14_06895 [Vibrio toranzoniae]
MKLLALNTKVKRAAQNLNTTDKTHLAKKRHTINGHGLKRFNWQRIRSTNLTTKYDQAICLLISRQDKENAPTN